jgi:Icc protein
MKLLWFTDLHIVAPGEILKGVDPAERFGRCLERALQSHRDADMLVVTGDLAQGGAPAAYATLHRMLAEVALPHRLIPGNHDDLAALEREHYRKSGYSVRRFHRDDREGVALLFLNTMAPGAAPGLDAEQLDWLSGQLDGRGGGQTLIFMHHPPFPTGIPAVDDDGFLRRDALLERLGAARRPPHLMCGHCHRTLSGSWSGIPFTVLSSVHLEFRLNLATPALSSYRSDPAYAVILADGETVAVHFETLAGPGEAGGAS